MSYCNGNPPSCTDEAKSVPAPPNLQGEPLHFQLHLYDLVRRFQPKIIVETGVKLGFSSWYVLHALAANGCGALYSVDPCPTPFPAPCGIWHHRREESWIALPKMLPVLSPIDFFLHDSDHSYLCQSFEYAFAWYHICQGGVIASDDATWNRHDQTGPHRAWDRFCEEVGVEQQEAGYLRYAIKPAP